MRLYFTLRLSSLIVILAVVTTFGKEPPPEVGGDDKDFLPPSIRGIIDNASKEIRAVESTAASVERSVERSVGIQNPSSSSLRGIASDGLKRKGRDNDTSNLGVSTRAMPPGIPPSATAASSGGGSDGRVSGGESKINNSGSDVPEWKRRQDELRAKSRSQRGSTDSSTLSSDSLNERDDRVGSNNEQDARKVAAGTSTGPGPYKKLNPGDPCPDELPDIEEAMKNGDGEMVKCIAKAMMNGPVVKKATSSCTDDFADDALYLASAQGDLEMVKCLVDKGASKDLTFKKGRTALMEACRAGEKAVKVVEVLIERGAKLDLQDDRGKTALMYAAHHGVQEVVEKLIQKGARVDIVDEDGKTAVMIAFDNSHEHVVKAIDNAVCAKFTASCLKFNTCTGPLAVTCLSKSRLTGTTRYVQPSNPALRAHIPGHMIADSSRGSQGVNSNNNK